MSDSAVKVRFCAAEGCSFRMSSLDKDPHLLCPGHTGWQCAMNQRCNVCAEWPDEMMKAYCVLQEHKAKNRAYREKKRFMKSANGKQGGTPGPSPAHGSAHFMSPSVSSQESTGKTEPVSSVSVLPKCSSYVTTDRELDNVVITVNSGDFAPPVIEVNPPPSVECSKDKIGSLSQGSAGLPKCSVSLEEKEGVKGKGVDDLLTDEQKLVSRLITGEIGVHVLGRSPPTAEPVVCSGRVRISPAPSRV